MALSTQEQALAAHFATGTSTVCRCWKITRKDGQSFGFTDHDKPLAFDGLTFAPATGLTGKAVAQSTGLAVDNTEAIGALTSDALREDEIRAGLFDEATVDNWLVNWQDVSARHLQFRGTIGEITLQGGAFQAELRGLTEKLSTPTGRIFQRTCDAVLGDSRCGVNLSSAAYRADVAVATVVDAKTLRFAGLDGYAAEWFARGKLEVLTGAAAGLVAFVQRDSAGNPREIGLWEDLRLAVEVGDLVRLTAGCDKTSATCRAKFNNFINFQGFPHMPGDDWVTGYPTRNGVNDGASLFAGGDS